MNISDLHYNEAVNLFFILLLPLPLPPLLLLLDPVCSLCRITTTLEMASYSWFFCRQIIAD